MATFLLLECQHFFRARRKGVERYEMTWCPKCQVEHMVTAIHTSSFRVVCEDCRYRRRFGDSQSAYGAANYHYQDTGHATRVLVDHPSAPGGAVTLTSYEQKRYEQQALPTPF